MCTAVSFLTRDHYFGRNLDLEYSYEESVTITPRNYPFRFRNGTELSTHYALIGMAYVYENTPLYYEATNEKGLSMAGLNFPGYAVYHPAAPGKENIASFELLSWLLGQCADLSEVREKLKNLQITDEAFSPQLPASTLHWMVADRTGSLVLESVAEGLKIHENPVGILTNSPPFDYQMCNLRNYMALTREFPENRFAPGLELTPYSRGMGAMGLPGDLSSASRFVKAVFTRMNSVCGSSESESISQFFHILSSVEQQRGCVHMGEGKYEFTIYSCCCNTDRGIYYYTTYENSQITGVDMHKENLDGTELVSYPLVTGQQILMQN